MHRTLKTLLLLLLIAALPLQGAAAAMRLSCGPAQHHPPAQAASATGAHYHHAAVAHSDSGHSAFDAASAEQTPAVQDGHAHSYCSACAACCVGAAAPLSSSIPTAPPKVSEFIAVAPAPLLAGFIPTSLERPPRTVFP